MEGKLAAIEVEQCTFCGACVQRVQVRGHRHRDREAGARGPGQYRGVWVFGEQHDGESGRRGPES